jgi:hypothetical protein
MDTQNEPVDPCLAERKARDEARREWLRLEGRGRPDVTPQPRRFGEDAVPVHIDLTAGPKADAAKVLYEEAERALRRCLRAHRGDGPADKRAGTSG